MKPWSACLPTGGNDAVRHVALIAAAQCLRVDASGQRWNVYRPGDLEALWRQMGEADFGPDERIPYWVELWPASLLLAKWLGRQQERIRGKTCLDVGCGLGLSACVAATAGAQVVGLDYIEDALHYARANARENRVAAAPLWVQMDWRWPGLKAGGFDVIWGADIFYEKRFASPLKQLFKEVLAPNGRIWLAEPERSVSSGAWDQLREAGFEIRLAAHEAVPTEGYAVTINIWEAQQTR
ncbi:class I SAM-dependent methyltransferase [Desulfonatronum thioautotrophicum]|uniref:class I SAM-dependent methyltransferase n=1 Tax=Desulfonatronum thioautotrophicum TaxID=617001 RepID=UPI000A0650FB|nr:methyltransferase domain-containing protein [Desulfonatronum thioautotrophicum]